MKKSKSRYNLTDKEIHNVLIKGINGRRIKKIGVNTFLLEEPNDFKMNSYKSLRTEIIIAEKQIIFQSTSVISYLLSGQTSIVLIANFIFIGINQSNWEFGFTLSIPLVWLAIPLPFHIGYIFILPIINSIKERLKSILNETE